jgi:hypothetical protein
LPEFLGQFRMRRTHFLNGVGTTLAQARQSIGDEFFDRVVLRRVLGL